MRLLYSLSIYIYGTLILFASKTGNSKAKEWIKGRVNWKTNLRNAIPKDKKTVWFHCASLGEFEQARPLIERIKSNNSSYFILLSFFSPSGYNSVFKSFKDADYICYLPLDTSANAKKFIELANIEFAVFTKYEFWYNYISQLHKSKIKIYLISSIFRKSQIFFKKYGSWFAKHLKFYSSIFTQDLDSKSLLNDIGIEAIQSGDTRFDRVLEISKTNNELPIEKYNNTIIFGSSWDKENELASRLYHEKENIRLIIAPHEIRKDKIEKLKSSFGSSAILWSEFKKKEKVEFKVLIVDKIGLLSSLYRYAHIAVVGGGFGKGIHNLLEAAVYQIPVIFGPNHQKFREAIDLINHEGAFSIDSYSEFKSIVDRLIADEEFYKEYSSNAFKYVNSMLGATDTIYLKLKEDFFLK